MKRIITGLIALIALASANAQTPISSVNAAGYIKITVQPDKFYFVQTPFNKFDGSPSTLNDLLGTSLPDSTEVYVWNNQTQLFDISFYTEGFGYDPNIQVSRGSGFFVKPSSFGTQASYDLFLAGEVPGATSAQTTQIAIRAGFNAVGFPYPVSTTLINSGLTEATRDSDEVYAWDAAGQGYDVYFRLEGVAGFEWSGEENAVIAPGTALFVKAAGQAQFQATVPYSWPNN